MHWLAHRMGESKPSFRTRETIYGMVEDRWAILGRCKDWLNFTQAESLKAPPPDATCIIVERVDGGHAVIRFKHEEKANA